MAKRPTQPMPGEIRDDMEERGVADDYDERPFYQRNDYLAWIGRAARPETRRKRIDQMVDELTKGGVYMGMTHAPSRKD